jgi:hypothetical protein
MVEGRCCTSLCNVAQQGHASSEKEKRKEKKKKRLEKIPKKSKIKIGKMRWMQLHFAPCTERDGTALALSTASPTLRVKKMLIKSRSPSPSPSPSNLRSSLREWCLSEKDGTQVTTAKGHAEMCELPVGQNSVCGLLVQPRCQALAPVRKHTTHLSRHVALAQAQAVSAHTDHKGRGQFSRDALRDSCGDSCA